MAESTSQISPESYAPKASDPIHFDTEKMQG